MANIIKITKKEFKKIHSDNKLEIIHPMTQIKLSIIRNVLKQNMKYICNQGNRTTKIDLDDHKKSGTSKIVLKEEIDSFNVYYCVSRYDNSKNYYTSRNDIQITTIVYFEKKVKK